MVKHDNIPGFWGYYVSPKGIIWTIRSRNGRGKAKFWRKVNPMISHKGRLPEYSYVKMEKYINTKFPD